MKLTRDLPIQRKMLVMTLLICGAVLCVDLRLRNLVGCGGELACKAVDDLPVLIGVLGVRGLRRMARAAREVRALGMDTGKGTRGNASARIGVALRNRRDCT